jgi:transposase-like protein
MPEKRRRFDREFREGAVQARRERGAVAALRRARPRRGPAHVLVKKGLLR